MDAFVVRKRRSPQEQLLDKDAFLFPPSDSTAAASGADGTHQTAELKELKELVAANGGRLLTSAEDQDADGAARVIVVLHQQIQELQSRDVQMIARLLQRGAVGAGGAGNALVVRSQWVRDCVAQQQRLATHAYEQTRAVLALIKQDDESNPHAEGNQTSAQGRGNLDSDGGSKRRKVELSVTTPLSTDAAVVLDVIPRPNFTPWRDVNQESLLILDARSQEQQDAPATTTKKVKIAGFDMDGTWIETKSGKRFATDVNDWKWLHPTLVRAKLEELARTGYEIVLFSNQNGIAKGNVTAKEIQGKVQAIITKLNLPVLAILATKSDLMRKPRLGGWQEMLQILKIDASQVDMDASFYCGDAAGRPKTTGRSKDFAATDYKFAVNIGVEFLTPEALFLKSTQRIHTHTDMWETGFDPRPLCSASSGTFLAPPSAELAKTTQEIVILVGPPASGKSFFSKTHFATYAIINQDEFKTLANCKKACLEALAQKKSVIVDSTNRDPRSRGEWIAIAKQQNLPIRCFEMDIDKPLSMHLNTFRSLTGDKKIPDIAIHTFYKNLVPPQAREGFGEIVKVRFQVQRDQLSEKKLSGSKISSKIKDGLFMGDVDAAQDAEFLQLNGIVHIINCVPRQVPNLFQQSLGLSYTACDLDEVLRRPLFDLKNREFMNVVRLIDRSLEKTESVLVHSLNGLNRSPSLMIGYLVVKYCWGVDKTYDFMTTKRSDIKLDESYAEQFCALETQLQKAYPSRATEQQMYEWNPSTADRKTDEIVLVHTYLNATAKPNTTATSNSEHLKKKQPARAHRRLSWIDQSAQLDNGWVDILNPNNRPPAAAATSDQEHLQSTKGPVQSSARDRLVSNGVANASTDFHSGANTRSNLIVHHHQENISPDSELENAPMQRSSGNSRLQSFSMPKKKETEPEAQISQSPTSSSDRDELEVTYEYPGGSARHQQPRYLQETLASINSRQRKSSFRPTVTRTPSFSAPGTKTSLPAGANMNPIFTKILAASVVGGADTRASKSARMQQGKRPVDSMNPSQKPLAGRTPKSAGSGTAATGRVLFSADFPPPTTDGLGGSSGIGITPQGLGSSIRRSFAETSDPSSLAGAVRPRTAPPRMRKKEMETSDLLYSKRMDTGARMQVPTSDNSQPTRRTRSSLDFGPSATNAAHVGKSSNAPRRSTVGISTAPSASASFSRSAKSTRAQWK